MRTRRWRGLVGPLAGAIAISFATAASELAAPAQVVSPPFAFVHPQQGDIVPDVLGIELRAAGIRDDIHLLAADATTPSSYIYVEQIAAPVAGQAVTLSRLVDTTRFGSAGTFRLVAIASSALVRPASGQVDPRTLPPSAPMAIVEVHHAGAILTPARGAQVGAVDVVRAQGFLPGSYIAAIVRPVNDGGYWVQNAGIFVTPTVPLPIRVHFGGRGLYHLYLGVTHDRDLFDEGDRFTRLPERDRAGRPVFWLGPVEVTHP